MRRVCSLAIASLLAVSGAAALAQPAEELPLPERLDRALRDMMEDVKPSLDEALDYMRSFGAIDDPRHYQLPELLPNGDIIIRRREDAPEFRPDAPDTAPGTSPDVPGGPPAEDLPYDPGEGIRT
jgi:hypothetical protein